MFKNLKLFQPFNFFIWMTFYTAVTVIYFAKITGSYALAISLFSIVQISRATLEVPSGIFSDKFGRRQCQIIGAWLSLLTVFLFALAQNYWVLVIGAIFSGASQAFFSGNNDAMLFESLSRVKRQEKYSCHLGKIRSTTEMSFMVGSLIGSIIVKYSYSLLMWLSLVPQLIGLILSYQFVEPKRHLLQEKEKAGHLRQAIKLFKVNLSLRRLSLIQIIQFGLGEASWPLMIVFYNSILPAWQASLVVTSHFLISFFSYRLSGRVIKKMSALGLLIFGEVYSSILCLLALIFPTVFSPLIIAVASVVFGPSEVAKNTLIQEKLTVRQRATMSSMVSLVGSIFYAISGVFLGSMADSIGVNKTLITVQILLLPTLWLFIKIRKNSC